MERLHGVLAERTDDLAGLLAARGYDSQVAKRFVTVAGADLIHSYAWQSTELDGRDLSALPNVTRLLGGMHARKIARTVGLPVSEVWVGLRILVPEVLALASRHGPSAMDAPPERSFYAGPYASGRVATPLDLKRPD